MLQSDKPEPTNADDHADARPWLKFYDPGVPPHLDYPRMPLWQLLDDSAACYPDKPCTYFFGQETSYREIKEASDRFAAGLVRQGVRLGDRVALLLPNCPQFVIAYYGLQKAGAVGVLLNPLLTEPELAKHLAHSGAETIVTIPLFLAKARGVAAQTRLRRIIRTGLADYLPLPASLVMAYRERKQMAAARRIPSSSTAPAEVGMNELLARPVPAGFNLEAPEPDEPAVLLYSGGTTGVSKAVALSHYM